MQFAQYSDLESDAVSFHDHRIGGDRLQRPARQRLAFAFDGPGPERAGLEKVGRLFLVHVQGSITDDWQDEVFRDAPSKVKRR